MKGTRLVAAAASAAVPEALAPVSTETYSCYHIKLNVPWLVHERSWVLAGAAVAPKTRKYESTECLSPS